MPAINRLPGPYEPCYCNSGKKYKFCHYLIDSAPASDRREMSQHLYINKWDTSAEHFRGQGCYSWMASILAKYSPKRIFDIGCGNGNGVLALKAACPQNAKIISCDDNAQCLWMAHKKIRSIGINTKLIRRMEQAAAGEEFHEMKVLKGHLQIPPDCADVTLVEADVIWDTEFIEFLRSQQKFDAITVWLIGTYDLKPQCRNIGRMSEGQIYRLTVQNNVYALANEILRLGGVLQIVDRGESPNEQFLVEDTLRAHREQAEGTSLEVTDHQFMDYDEPNQGAGITMQLSLGKSGRVPELKQLAMSSITSVKR